MNGVWRFFAIMGFIFGLAGYVVNLAINSTQNYEIVHLNHEVHALQHPHKK